MGNWPAEPPSNAVALYLFYNIWFSDRAAYDAAVAQYGISVSRSPGFMRSALGISETANGWDGVDDTWIQFVSPPWVVDFNADGSWKPPITIKSSHAYVYPSDASGNPYWWPPDAYTFDYNQDWIQVPGHPSVPIWGAGRTLVWYWTGILLSKTGGVTSTPTTITPTPTIGAVVRQNIRPRRFSTGFETQNGGQDPPNTSPEGLGGTTQSEGYTRAASRTPDGIGYLSSSLGASCRYFLNDNGVPSNTRNSHERIYVKFQKFPTTATRFMTFNDDSNEVMCPTIDQFGALNGFVINNFSINSGPLGAGGTLALNTWYRLDCYIKFYRTATGSDARLIIKIQGTVVLNIVGTVNTGFGAGDRVHSDTQVFSGGNTMEVMYDDWENIDPGPTTNDATIGPDLQEGTIDYWTGVHMQLIKNNSFAESANWTATNGYPAAFQKQPANPLASIVSSTSGARLRMNTDMDAVIGNNSRIDFVRQQGTIALNALFCVSKSGGSVTDQIGVSHSAGTESMRTITMGATRDGYHYLVSVSAGLQDPKPIAQLEPCFPLHIKSTDGVTNTVAFLALEATFMGQYGTEDSLDPTFPSITPTIGYHNAPYWATYMGRATVPPPNTVGVAAGTYVGNGTFQTVVVTLPGIHWLMIRNTATHQQTWWHTTDLGPHLQVTDDDILPGLLIDIDINDNGDTELLISNSNNASNANGVTYQYVAFSDVMSRCLLNIPRRQENTGAVTSLFDISFLPEFAMMQRESVKNNSAAIGLWTKGPGMAADQAKQSTNVSPSSNALTFGTGTITEGSVIANLSYTRSYALWRQFADGIGTNPNVLYIGQYTGNGAGGTRSITVTLNGRRPLFAVVVPLNASSPFQRDPSNSGGNSNVLGSTSNLANGIVGGGIDTLNVGISLNTNLVVYSVFIIPSCSTTAGNDGWGINEVCGLAEPGWDGNEPPWALDPPAPPGFDIVGSGGLILSGNAAKTILQNVGGLYTLIPNQHHDHLQDTQAGQPTADVPIPNPYGKTGFIGG